MFDILSPDAVCCAADRGPASTAITLLMLCSAAHTKGELENSLLLSGPRVIMWFTPKAGGAGGSFRRRLFAGRLGKSKFVGPAQLRCVGPVRAKGQRMLRSRVWGLARPWLLKTQLVSVLHGVKAEQFGGEPSGELFPTLLPAHNNSTRIPRSA